MMCESLLRTIYVNGWRQEIALVLSIFCRTEAAKLLIQCRQDEQEFVK